VKDFLSYFLMVSAFFSWLLLCSVASPAVAIGGTLVALAFSWRLLR